MTTYNNNRINTQLVVLLAVSVSFLGIFAGCEQASDSSAERAAPAVGEPQAAAENERRPDSISYFTIGDDGKLIRPKGYRTWVYIGTPLTPNELNPPEAPFPEFHNVYIDPTSWDHYESTGTFRDGTIIIKELVSVGSKAAVSGIGYFMGEFVGLEATIKSSELFPDEPGNWAYFSFGHAYPLADSAEAFPTAACNACHAASAAQDFVFTQYYPVLRAVSAPEVAGPVTMGPAQRETLMTAMTQATAVIGQPRAETGASVGPVPTDLGALFKYLGERKYESFSHRESTVHPSRGPHAVFGRPVRTFLSDDLDASLKAGNASHPAGSSIVKEMYLEDGTTLEGWAVSVKTQDDSAGGNGWFWYEVVSTSDPTQLGGGQAGNGVPLCTGCHASGRDFVLSDYPLQ